MVNSLPKTHSELNSLLSLRDAHLQCQNQTSLVTPTLQALGCVFVTCSKFITGLLLTLCSGFPPRAFPSPLALSCRLLTSPPALRLHKHFAGFSFSNTLSIILTSSYIQLPVWLHKQLSRGESCGREEPSSSDQLFGYTYAL